MCLSLSLMCAERERENVYVCVSVCVCVHTCAQRRAEICVRESVCVYLCVHTCACVGEGSLLFYFNVLIRLLPGDKVHMSSNSQRTFQECTLGGVYVPCIYLHTR